MDHSALLQGARVLVVEDDPLQALDLCHSLAEAGADVLGPASDADRAAELMAAYSYHIAILDFRLGSCDIIPLAQELHRQRVPFILHTAYDCADVLPAQWRNWQLVSKPAHMDALIEAVAALVSEPKTSSCLRERRIRKTRKLPSPLRGSLLKDVKSA